MRISGTEPSSVILSQTKRFQKLVSDVSKSAKISWSQKAQWVNGSESVLTVRKSVPVILGTHNDS